MGRDPSQFTVQAIAAEHEGRVLGVAGLCFAPNISAFSDISDEMRAYPAAIMRAGVALKAMIAAQNRPVYAAAQHGILSSEAFLRRLGGEYSHKSKSGPVYVWLPQSMKDGG